MLNKSLKFIGYLEFTRKNDLIEVYLKGSNVVVNEYNKKGKLIYDDVFSLSNRDDCISLDSFINKHMPNINYTCKGHKVI